MLLCNLRRPIPRAQGQKGSRCRRKQEEESICCLDSDKKEEAIIVRRQSSQCSTDIAAKINAQISNQSSAKRILPTFSETHHNKGKAPPKFQENFSPATQ
jgi:hypothetical protein